jgi:hypothetical protein
MSEPKLLFIPEGKILHFSNTVAARNTSKHNATTTTAANMLATKELRRSVVKCVNSNIA